MGMALDPEWIKDMVNTYAQLLIELQEDLVCPGGYPDGIWFYEDKGFKGRPFMSPAMYRESYPTGPQADHRFRPQSWSACNHALLRHGGAAAAGHAGCRY